MNEGEKWDSRYCNSDNLLPTAAQVLTDFVHLLSPNTKALDLAAGLGGNALLLTEKGLVTSAWDISTVAMERLSTLAAQLGQHIDCQVRDVVAAPPPADSFDVIVVSRFLERELCPQLTAALRPGGLLFYQTFIKEKTDPSIGPGNPAYLLAKNELLHLFPTLQLIAYREEGTLGRTEEGFRNEAYLVAQRPQ